MNGLKTIPFSGDYINGRFVLSESFDAEWEERSPSDLKDIVIKVVRSPNGSREKLANLFGKQKPKRPLFQAR
jgi:hypothetical protein